MPAIPGGATNQMGSAQGVQRFRQQSQPAMLILDWESATGGCISRPTPNKGVNFKCESHYNTPLEDHELPRLDCLKKSTSFEKPQYARKRTTWAMRCLRIQGPLKLRNHPNLYELTLLLASIKTKLAQMRPACSCYGPNFSSKNKPNIHWLGILNIKLI